VAACGPAAGKLFIILKVTDSGDIIYESVEPDIADIIAVKGQFDSPGEAGFWTAYAEISEFLTQETECFIGSE
jgi:hypothetical protein